MSVSGAMLTARRSSEATRDRGWPLLPGLALAHGLVLLAFPALPTVALGLWWNSNTVSHNFIHRSVFRNRLARSIFSIYLTLLLGYPQSVWAARHLAHHGGRGANVRMTRLSLQMKLELLTVIALWTSLAVYSPHFLFYAYLPGFLIGMVLCKLHGHYEHINGETVNYYGRVYNFLFLNDGYHAEHHARPNAHWSSLPHLSIRNATVSDWPAVLRWFEDVPTKLRETLSISSHLCTLERLVLHSRMLQSFVLNRHEKAFGKLLGRMSFTPSRIGIVGGGLFPRTAIVLRRLLPETKLVLIDCSTSNLETARRFLGDGIETRNQLFEPRTTPEGIDALIVPLALVGERDQVYANPTLSAVFVHDWIWKRRGETAVVSWLLLKRLNLVTT